MNEANQNIEVLGYTVSHQSVLTDHSEAISSSYISATFSTGEQFILRQSENNNAFNSCVEHIKEKNWNALYTTMNPVKEFCGKIGNLDINGNHFKFKGVDIPEKIGNRIVQFATMGLDHEPLERFIEKLLLNPSKRAVDELFTFLDNKYLPITENGNFLAYKGLDMNYYSIHSGVSELIKGKTMNGKIFNGVGEEIEMIRNQVDDDKTNGCSHGLHAGSMEYAREFAQGKCVIVEINPKDVVSIPEDCSFQKLRTCRYKVVGEFEAPLYDPLADSNFDDPFDDDGLCEDCGCYSCSCSISH